jgi:hypothetical protein
MKRRHSERRRVLILGGGFEYRPAAINDPLVEPKCGRSTPINKVGMRSGKPRLRGAISPISTKWNRPTRRRRKREPDARESQSHRRLRFRIARPPAQNPAKRREFPC